MYFENSTPDSAAFSNAVRELGSKELDTRVAAAQTIARTAAYSGATVDEALINGLFSLANEGSFMGFSTAVSAIGAVSVILSARNGFAVAAKLLEASLEAIGKFPQHETAIIDSTNLALSRMAKEPFKEKAVEAFITNDAQGQKVTEFLASSGMLSGKDLRNAQFKFSGSDSASAHSAMRRLAELSALIGNGRAASYGAWFGEQLKCRFPTRARPQEARGSQPPRITSPIIQG